MIFIKRLFGKRKEVTVDVRINTLKEKEEELSYEVISLSNPYQKINSIINLIDKETNFRNKYIDINSKNVVNVYNQNNILTSSKFTEWFQEKMEEITEDNFIESIYSTCQVVIGIKCNVGKESVGDVLKMSDNLFNKSKLLFIQSFASVFGLDTKIGIIKSKEFVLFISGTYDRFIKFKQGIELKEEDNNLFGDLYNFLEFIPSDFKSLPNASKYIANLNEVKILNQDPLLPLFYENTNRTIKVLQYDDKYIDLILFDLLDVAQVIEDGVIDIEQNDLTLFDVETGKIHLIHIDFTSQQNIIILNLLISIARDSGTKEKLKEILNIVLNIKNNNSITKDTENVESDTASNNYSNEDASFIEGVDEIIED